MALRTDSINAPVEKKLEEGYEFVVDEEGRRALKKIRSVKEEKPAKVSKKASKKAAKKAAKEE